VLIPPSEFVLVTKLIGYRDKDYNDVKTLLEQLQITERVQAFAVLFKYGVDEETQREYFVDDALDNFFDV
jgi:hypothetical protein